MNKAQQFTTFVSRLKACAEVRNMEGAMKVIQEGKLILRLPNLMAKDQITVLQSFEKLGLKYQGLWEAIASSFNLNMDKKLPFEIATLGSILAKNLKSDMINWACIEDRILHGDKSSLAFDPYVVNIHTFFATFNKGSDKFWNSTEKLCIESLNNGLQTEANKHTLNNLLSKLIWSYGTMKKGSPAFWSEITKLCRTLINDHTPKTYSKMVLAVSKIKLLPEDLKLELIKQAPFHLSDQGLPLSEFYEMILGIDNIDPSSQSTLTDQIADSVLNRLKSDDKSLNKTNLSYFHRIFFELIEIRGLSETKRITLEEELANRINGLNNITILDDFEERALVYFATLPAINKSVLNDILRMIDSKNYKVESLISSEPGDYQLLMDFIKISERQAPTIEATLGDNFNQKQAFIINKLGISLAKFEIGKTSNYPTSFYKDLSSSLGSILEDYLAAITSSSLPPPESTMTTTKILLNYLDGTISLRILLRHFARMYSAFSNVEISSSNSHLLTVLYLRHHDEVGKLIENFVLKNQHLLYQTPFLMLSLCALKNKVSNQDKVSLLRHIDQNSDHLEPLVLVNSLIFFRELTLGNKVSQGTFAIDPTEAKEKLKNMLESAHKYMQTGSWGPETKDLFKFSPKSKQEDQIIVPSKPENEPKTAQPDERLSSKQTTASIQTKEQERSEQIDLLGSYLESKYPEDPDFPRIDKVVVASSDHKEKKSVAKSSFKKHSSKKKSVEDHSDLIFSQPNKNNRLEDIEKIKIGK